MQINAAKLQHSNRTTTAVPWVAESSSETLCVWCNNWDFSSFLGQNKDNKWVIQKKVTEIFFAGHLHITHINLLLLLCDEHITTCHVLHHTVMYLYLTQIQGATIQAIIPCTWYIITCTNSTNVTYFSLNWLMSTLAAFCCIFIISSFKVAGSSFRKLKPTSVRECKHHKRVLHTVKNLNCNINSLQSILCTDWDKQHTSSLQKSNYIKIVLNFIPIYNHKSRMNFTRNICLNPCKFHIRWNFQYTGKWRTPFYKRLD